jgi:hypothetical protein
MKEDITTEAEMKKCRMRENCPIMQMAEEGSFDSINLEEGCKKYQEFEMRAEEKGIYMIGNGRSVDKESLVLEMVFGLSEGRKNMRHTKNEEYFQCQISRKENVCQYSSTL